MVDDHTDFAVEQDCRIGMDTQNIGGRTGGNFEYKKAEQFFLYFFLSFAVCYLHILRVTYLLI